MQRATAITGRWVGALSAGLALPFSFSVHAASLDGALAAARAQVSPGAAASASVLERWHDYALSSITPQFSWALQPASLSAPRVLDNYSATVVRAPLFRTGSTEASRFELSVASGRVSETPAAASSTTSQLVGSSQPGLQRTVVTPALTQAWGEHGSLRLTGVLAYQRFASLGLGTTVGMAAPLVPWFGDTSYGAGARIDVGDALGERLHWNFGYQSRVGMSAFSNYRGVFADPGHFDIPASAMADLGYAITPSLGVDIGVQRVMYSEITPFASPSLPTRFLALLGSGSSPVFAWRDLDVYSIGWTLRDATIGELQLRYTTRQQPVPTSKLLANALAPATANDMVSLGWSRAVGTSGSVGFSASYATSPYYLLVPTYLPRSNATASQFEFEAFWSTRF